MPGFSFGADTNRVAERGHRRVIYFRIFHQYMDDQPGQRWRRAYFSAPEQYGHQSAGNIYLGIDVRVFVFQIQYF